MNKLDSRFCGTRAKRSAARSSSWPVLWCAPHPLRYWQPPFPAGRRCASQRPNRPGPLDRRHRRARGLGSPAQPGGACHAGLRESRTQGHAHHLRGRSRQIPGHHGTSRRRKNRERKQRRSRMGEHRASGSSHQTGRRASRRFARRRLQPRPQLAKAIRERRDRRSGNRRGPRVLQGRAHAQGRQAPDGVLRQNVRPAGQNRYHRQLAIGRNQRRNRVRRLSKRRRRPVAPPYGQPRGRSRNS